MLTRVPHGWPHLRHGGQEAMERVIEGLLRRLSLPTALPEWARERIKDTARGACDGADHGRGVRGQCLGIPKLLADRLINFSDWRCSHETTRTARRRRHLRGPPDPKYPT